MLSSRPGFVSNLAVIATDEMQRSGYMTKAQSFETYPVAHCCGERVVLGGRTSRRVRKCGDVERLQAKHADKDAEAVVLHGGELCCREVQARGLVGKKKICGGQQGTHARGNVEEVAQHV